MAIINIIKNQTISEDNIATEDLSSFVEPGKTFFLTSNAFKKDSLEIFLNGIYLSRNNDFIENINGLSFILNVDLNLLSTMNKDNTSLVAKYEKL